MSSVPNDSMAKALSIELIREKILFHALCWKIKEKEPDLYWRVERKVVPTPGNVNLLRQVNSDWLDIVTRLLQREPYPVFSFPLERRLYTDEHYEGFQGFVRKMLDDNNTLYPREGESVLTPPFAVYLYWDFFLSWRNRRLLRDCLVNMGGHLKELLLAFPQGCTLPLDENFTLPRLTSFQVYLLTIHPQGYEEAPEPLVDANGRLVASKTLLEVVALILERSPRLTCLEFSGSQLLTNPGYESALFRRLTLPPSLEEVYFNGILESPIDIAILLAPQNPLPHLKSLSLFAWEEPFNGDTILQILRKFRNTLVYLNLEGSDWLRGEGARAEHVTTFRVPRLPLLRHLRVTSQRWNLEQDEVNNLPALEYLARRECVEQDLVAHAVQYPTVRTFSLLLVEDRTEDEEIDNEIEYPEEDLRGQFLRLPVNWYPYPVLALTPEHVQRMQVSCPNLTELYLSVNSAGGLGLAQIFVSYPRLTKLDLRVAPGLPGATPTFWDELITGMSAARVTQMRSLLELHFPEKDEELMLTNLAADGEATGIATLTQLGTVLLAGQNREQPFITDLSFYFGFLKMPQLEKLTLGGAFRPSERMTQRWNTLYRDQPGKCLLCYPSYTDLVHSNYQ